MALILNDWDQIVTTAPWTERALHRVVSDGTYMYMTGGYNNDGPLVKFSDVWRSADGETWEQLTADGGYGARSAHGFFYFNGKFYIMGGSDEGGSFLGDVWSSNDCINWERIVEDAPWDDRHEFAFVEYDGYMWITGGFNGLYLTDAWRSVDGISWSLVSNDITAGQNGVREHVAVPFGNFLWIYGGDDLLGGAYQDWMISSPDGVNWTDNGSAAWEGRKEHQAVVDTDGSSVAIVGGQVWLNATNDVWQTSDGINWIEITQISSFTARSDFGLVNHRGRTYIIGGIDGSDLLGDVWASEYALYCNFEAIPSSGTAQLSVSFTPEVTGTPTSYFWDFGDGATSVDENPTHIFTTPGRYTVSLKVENASSEYIETKQNYITVGLDFMGTPVEGHAPLNVSFGVGE